jgi:hypothetical protein
MEDIEIDCRRAGYYGCCSNYEAHHLLRSDEKKKVSFQLSSAVETRVGSSDLIEYEFGLAGQVHSCLHLT